MKNYSLALLLLLLFVCFVAGYGQGNIASDGVAVFTPLAGGSFGSLSAEEKFRRSAHQLVDPPEMSRRIAKGEIVVPHKSATSPGAGEQVVLQILPARNKLRPGESTDILLSRVQTSGRVRVAARYFQAGSNGEYDGTIPIAYIGNPDFNFNANLDLSSDQQFYKLITLQISPWAKPGRHQLDVAVWTENGDLLLQQTFIDLYVYDRGPNDPVFEIRSAVQRANVVLSGRFPVGVPAWYFVGTPFYGSFWNYAAFAAATADSSGSQIIIPGSMGYTNTTDYSVYLLFPTLRYALMSRDAFAKRIQ